MFSQKSVKGFTLIELLVVVAIIGILATIVIGAVNSARIKGADAAIKGNMANVRPSAELIFDSTGSYSAVCTGGNKTLDGILAALRIVASTATASSIASSGSASATQAVCTVNGTNTAWGAISPLRSSTTSFWCVDSTGANNMTTNASLSAAAACQ